MPFDVEQLHLQLQCELVLHHLHPLCCASLKHVSSAVDAGVVVFVVVVAHVGGLEWEVKLQFHCQLVGRGIPSSLRNQLTKLSCIALVKFELSKKVLVSQVWSKAHLYHLFL